MWKKETGYGWSTRVLTVFLWLLVFGSMATAFASYQKTKVYAAHRSLRYEGDVMSGEQMDSYYKSREKEEQQVSEITVWKKQSQQSFAGGDFERPVTGTVVKAYGDMADVFPQPMEQGSFPYKEDEQGCAISSSAALQMFGSLNVCGMEVEYEGKIKIIRGVFKSREYILAVNASKTEAMPYAEITLPEKNTVLETVLSKAGFPKPRALVDGDFLRACMQLMLMLPFWTCWLLWYIRYRKRKKALTVGYAYLGGVAFVVSAVLGLYLSNSFGAEFIPTRWSDFQFWGDKVKGIVENQEAGLSFRGLYFEQMIYGELRRVWVCSLVAVGGVAALGYKRNSPLLS